MCRGCCESRDGRDVNMNLGGRSGVHVEGKGSGGSGQGKGNENGCYDDGGMDDGSCRRMESGICGCDDHEGEVSGCVRRQYCSRGRKCVGQCVVSSCLVNSHRNGGCFFGNRSCRCVFCFCNDVHLANGFRHRFHDAVCEGVCSGRRVMECEWGWGCGLCGGGGVNGSSTCRRRRYDSRSVNGGKRW